MWVSSDILYSPSRVEDEIICRKRSKVANEVVARKHPVACH